MAAGAWPIELWGEDARPEMRFLPEHDHYTIPPGALRSAHLSNLWAAGRTLSATDAAIASARVIATCMSTGYAAGTLAAASALGRHEQAAIDELRATNLPR